MAWQVIERKVMRSTAPSIAISKQGRLNFNGAATKILHDGNIESVLLLWDADARKIGIQRIGKRDARGYTVRFAPKYNWSGFAAKNFLEQINYDYSKTQSYPAEWDKTEEMFVFSLPSSSEEKELQQGQQHARPGRGQTRTHSEIGMKSKASASG
jgi:hypothetical protein